MPPFHAGELAVQERMGQAATAARIGGMIRADISLAAASFLAEQPMVVIAAADARGRLWAGELIGAPGFARAVDAGTLVIEALPPVGDPLRAALSRPARVGMIALQPQRRRRIRVNGTAEPAATGLRISTDQVYANCPKYISRRQPESYQPQVRPGEPRYGSELDARQQATLAATDTFFVATADADGHADASHRGGNPGFLQVLSPTRLRWPDYPGNSLFMTLGNIAVQPRCGLLVPDWSTGTTLQISGTAELSWDTGTFTAGAQCSIDFTVTDVVEISGAVPLRWGAAELSPVNP